MASADVWARSVVTVFASPLSMAEFVAAIMALGLIKVTLTLLAVTGVAFALYAFNLFDLGFALLPFFANLVLLGWTMGLLCMAVILRWGGRWAIIAWSLPALLMPFSSVLWPESVLPPLATTADASPNINRTRAIALNPFFQFHSFNAGIPIPGRLIYRKSFPICGEADSLVAGN